MREFVHSLVIHAPPAAVLDAFFDPDAVTVWWQASRAVCTPRPFGGYAIEWEPTNWRDEVLGPLGGAFHGTVMDFKPGREFFIADLYWLPPEGDPIGPMALEASCQMQGDDSVLRLRQSGHDASSPRWGRYYDIASVNWVSCLEALKKYLEERWSFA
jgi:uncharacterized protein YndB with AHSA1/START domain